MLVKYLLVFAVVIDAFRHKVLHTFSNIHASELRGLDLRHQRYLQHVVKKVCSQSSKVHLASAPKAAARSQSWMCARPAQWRAQEAESSAGSAILSEFVTTGSGVQMPRLIYKVNGLQKESVEECVLSALRAGFLGLDTVGLPDHHYKAGVGAPLALLLTSGMRRNSLFIQTKISISSAAELNPGLPLAKQVELSIANSLSNLGLDYVDSLLLEYPYSDIEGALEAWTAMEDAVRAGKVLQLGISIRNVVPLTQLKRLLTEATVKPAVVQQQSFFAEATFERELRALFHGVYFQSSLKLMRTQFSAPRLLASKGMQSLADKYDVSPEVLFFRFVMDQRVVPLIGTSSTQHMMEGLSARLVPLTVQDAQVIHRLQKQNTSQVSKHGIRPGGALLVRPQLAQWMRSVLEVQGFLARSSKICIWEPNMHGLPEVRGDPSGVSTAMPPDLVEQKLMLLPLTAAASELIFQNGLLPTIFTAPESARGDDSASGAPPVVDPAELREGVDLFFLAEQGVGSSAVSQLANASNHTSGETLALFTFVDLFAGIGGFRLALEHLGGRCVASCELDRFARQTYQLNFHQQQPEENTAEALHLDITRLPGRALPSDVDVLTAGFPCQSFSALGNMHGFDDAKSGALFFHLLRIISETRPKSFLLENVRGLVTMEGGAIIAEVVASLEHVGYIVHYRLIDAARLLPQQRKRIYIVGIRKDVQNMTGGYSFPHIPQLQRRIGEVLQTDPNGISADSQRRNDNEHGNSNEALDEYRLPQHLWEKIRSQKELWEYPKLRLCHADDPNAKTIVSRYKDLPLFHSQFVIDHVANMSMATNRSGVRSGSSSLQRLQSDAMLESKTTMSSALVDMMVPPESQPPRFFTPRECARLQGFPEDYRIPSGNEYNRFYKQVGNSVAPPMVCAILAPLVRQLMESRRRNPAGGRKDNVAGAQVSFQLHWEKEKTIQLLLKSGVMTSEQKVRGWMHEADVPVMSLTGEVQDLQEYVFGFCVALDQAFKDEATFQGKVCSQTALAKADADFSEGQYGLAPQVKHALWANLYSGVVAHDSPELQELTSYVLRQRVLLESLPRGIFFSRRFDWADFPLGSASLPSTSSEGGDSSD